MTADATTSSGLRWFKGKTALAFFRGGDYTHPGNEEAIIKTLELCKINTDPKRTILDVGCGLGGTSFYLQQHGFGKITGFDYDSESISYAKNAYPDINFIEANVVGIEKILAPNNYDVIIIFSAFVLFNKQAAALASLNKLCNKNTKLIIFDYTDLLYPQFNPFCKTTTDGFFKPINLKTCHKLFIDNGWEIESIENIDQDCTRWYLDLYQNIISKKQEFLEKFNDFEIYEKVLLRYKGFFQAYNDKILGGVVICANPLFSN